MEYLVLARKWRPQVFEEVLGQEHVVRTLSNAITRQRIAHAFLFSGPRGVGKTSIARILAKALNCVQGATPTPCNVCANCREITDGIAIDVREIDGASNRGIDEIRELRENVKFAPASCRYKVYIIDEVHMLTREAFNALLKTLEEPPAHVIFMFATTETQKVPATILSRCQCFDLRRIPVRLIADNLKRIAEADGVRISDPALSWIAEAADGSLRDSQSIFDQVIAYGGFTIEDGAVEEILGRADRRFLFHLSEAVLGRDAARCLKIVDDAYYAGLDMKFFYQTLLGHFRNLLLAGMAGAESLLADLPAEDAEKLRVRAAGATSDTLQRYLEILMAEEETVRRSQNPRLNLETILCRMAWLEPLIPIETVLSRMERLERCLSAGDAPRVPEGAKGGEPDGGLPERPGRAAANPTVQRDGAPPGRLLEDRAVYRTGSGSASPGGCNEFKEFVKRKDAALGAKIEAAQWMAAEEGSLRIGFVKGYIFREDVEAKKAALAELARLFFGRETRIGIETIEPEAAGSAKGGDNGNGPAGRADRNHRLQEIRREALSHPLVQKVLDVFPHAEVRDVKLRQTPAAASVPAPALPDEEDGLLPDEAADLPPADD